MSSRRRIAVTLGAVMVAAAAIIVSSAVLIIRHNQHAASGQALRPSGIPADISASLADLMQLSPVPPARAPGFTLTDQNGHTLALSAFRGKVIVLEFMDPHCVDICPLVSDEFIDAYHDLGPAAGKVVFAAVNVNPYHPAIRDVAQFSRTHQLVTIPAWHFFTGPVPRLRAIWHAYNILVQTRGRSADIIHSSEIYFIDPHGRERYLASPMADHTKAGSAYLPPDQIASWGRGIALVARHLAY